MGPGKARAATRAGSTPAGPTTLLSWPRLGMLRFSNWTNTGSGHRVQNPCRRYWGPLATPRGVVTELPPRTQDVEVEPVNAGLMGLGDPLHRY